MCKILFWNVNRKDLSDTLCSIVQSTSADIVVLCEAGTTSEVTLGVLQGAGSFVQPQSNSTDRFQCFARSTDFDLTELHKGARSSYKELIFKKQEFLLGLVHGLDLRNYDHESRQSYAERLGSEFRFVISEKRINKLIVLGDFNMNPYDRSMNLASGFNAMSTKACVQSGKRTHLGVEYDLYYNPMWSKLGDESDGPAGTIFDTSNQGPYGWSAFDQVLFHHSAVEYYDDVNILTSTGSTNLSTKKGHPNSFDFSDHYPILVTLRGKQDD